MNIYMRKENRGGNGQRPKPLRFPVARYNRNQLPLHGPFLSFMPSIPMFVDRLTKQTIIFSPSGGTYIIPPLINFYGKMYSVAELIAYGYASLVSSGVPPIPPMNFLPYFQPTPLYGPDIPRINPMTGSFSDGVRTNYHSFKIPKYESSNYESSEEENYNDEDHYDRRPKYRERNDRRPRYRVPDKQEKDSDKVCNIKFSSPVSYAPDEDAETVYVYDFNNDKIDDIVALYYKIIGSRPFGLFINNYDHIYVANRADGLIRIWLNGSSNVTMTIFTNIVSPLSVFVTNQDDI
ncbi:hypothetical protein I4U23_011181 [Adineta vaga]|nr:hypothetical protein I4U23_011181 [Adineta vaga]